MLTGAFTPQLTQQPAAEAWALQVASPWWGQLNSKSDKNKAVIMVPLFSF